MNSEKKPKVLFVSEPPDGAVVYFVEWPCGTLSRMPSEHHARACAAVFELVGALQRMMKVYAAMMPGVRYIAIQDYQELNEAPCAARSALTLAGETA